MLPGCVGTLVMIFVAFVGVQFVDGLASFVMLVLIATGLTLAAGLYTLKCTREIDDNEKSEYENTWYCTRCAKKFIAR